MNTAARHPARRRGGVYVLVLSVSMLVMIIGVSGIVALRAKQQAGDLSAQSVQALQLARAAVDIGALAIDDDPNWRTGWTNGGWVWSTKIDGVRVGFSAVDEGDGDLADDDTDPVRIYGFASSDSATRVLSVELTPEVNSDPVELLNDGTFESSTDGWFARLAGTAAISKSGAQSGSGCLELSGRTIQDDGVAVDITDLIVDGQELTFSFWGKTGTGASQLFIKVYVVTDTVAFLNQSPVAPMIDTSWSYQSVSITPTWSGTKVQALLSITTLSGNAPLYFDEVSLTAPSDDVIEKTLVQTVGSWRREVLE